MRLTISLHKQDPGDATEPDLAQWLTFVYDLGSAYALGGEGASVVWRISLPLMNSFNKTEVTIF